MDFRIDQTISIVHWIRFQNRNEMAYVICVVFYFASCESSRDAGRRHRKCIRMLTCLTIVNNVCNVPLCKINISFIRVKMPDQQRVMVGTHLTVRTAVRSASICVNFKWAKCVPHANLNSPSFCAFAKKHNCHFADAPQTVRPDSKRYCDLLACQLWLIFYLWIMKMMQILSNNTRRRQRHIKWANIARKFGCPFQIHQDDARRPTVQPSSPHKD